jgi:hypothetical protein
MTSPDFIELYENALPAEACRSLVERFEASGQATRGRAGGAVDTRLKDSWDIDITRAESTDNEWSDAESALNAAMLRGLMTYVRKYPHAIVAPLSLRVPDPKGGGAVLVHDTHLTAMPDHLLQALVTQVFRPGAINLQKYVADEGGYPYWHSEHYPKADGGETLHRTLLWSIYLNDGFGEGETEFLHQRRKIAPKTGALLIAPTAFTHTHRGNMPRGGDKFIATSWVLFRRAEALYRGPNPSAG